MTREKRRTVHRGPAGQSPATRGRESIASGGSKTERARPTKAKAKPRAKANGKAKSGALEKVEAEEAPPPVEIHGSISQTPVATEEEEGFMRAALDLARRAEGRTSPNPAVGAIIVKDGEIIATGYHAYAGADHAEVAALREVEFNAPGGALYTTLEPCDHTGRTGPCTEAILRSGIERVVVGALDPNPIVSGRGIRRLVGAGIDVKQGVLEDDCRMLNEAFNFAIVHERSFVVLKAGMSLDGRIATGTGESRWITSEEARKEVHVLRDRLDAILVGVGTVIADDPNLTARIEGARNPVRVILDSRLRIPQSAIVVQTAAENRTVIATTEAAPARKRAALEKSGVEIMVLGKDGEGRVNLPQLLHALYERQLNSVLVEGGPTVLGAFVDARLVNKVVLFVAPMLIGGESAKGVVAGRGAARLTDAFSLEQMSVRAVGRDLMITAYPRGQTA